MGMSSYEDDLLKNKLTQQQQHDVAHAINHLHPNDRSYFTREEYRQWYGKQAPVGPLSKTFRARHHINLHDKLAFFSNYSSKIAQYYGLPLTQGNGVGQTIGIVEFGGGLNQSDVNAYCQQAGISPAPVVTIVSVDGAPNAPGKDLDSDGEVELDFQIPMGLAPAAKYVLYMAPNSEQGFVDAFTTAVHDTVNTPDIISCSWGGPENTWSANGLTSLHNVFIAASTMGVTISAASGDSGASDGEMGLNTDYPASDPYVLACGGTTIAAIAPGSAESCWTPYSGGGVSSTWPLPGYQSNASPPIPKTTSGDPVVNFAGRGVPDICAVGDPNSGFTVVIDGQTVQGVGGTSCVAPFWSGFIALCNQINKKNAGFINGLLYANPTVLKDITSGNNGRYQAGVGWDACTGLGSPTVGVLTVLAGGSAPPPPAPPPPPPTSTLTVANISVKTPENTPVVLTLVITSPASDTASKWNILTNPAHGTLAVGTAPSPSSLAVTYTPTTGFLGTDSFQYQATDESGNLSNIGVATIMVKPARTTACPIYRLEGSLDGGLTWKILYVTPSSGAGISDSSMFSSDPNTSPYSNPMKLGDIGPFYRDKFGGFGRGF